MTLREKIIEHFTKNPGVNVHFSTLGTTWSEASPIFEALFAEGVLVRRAVKSATGRNISKIFVGETK